MDVLGRLKSCETTTDFFVSSNSIHCVTQAASIPKEINRRFRKKRGTLLKNFCKSVTAPNISVSVAKACSITNCVWYPKRSADLHGRPPAIDGGKRNESDCSTCRVIALQLTLYSSAMMLIGLASRIVQGSEHLPGNTILVYVKASGQGWLPEI